MAADFRQLLGVVLGALATGCPQPPSSQFPSADAALKRMRDTYSCSRGVQGEAKLEYNGKEGRIRADMLYIAMLPEQLSFSVISPFGVTLSRLTSDGRDFALFDFREKLFLQGPANTCNVTRFTQVPVPPFALAQMFRGESPVLVHQPNQASIKWEGGFLADGQYVIAIQSKHGATQEIRIRPSPDDWELPWEKQRIRVLEVAVTQNGYELYRAVLDDHKAAQTAPAYKDPDGLDPTLPPSGPACNAEIPRRMRLEVPDTDQELTVRVKEVHHNPPLQSSVFQQATPTGVQVRSAVCRD
jgi:hypothetical protein